VTVIASSAGVPAPAPPPAPDAGVRPPASLVAKNTLFLVISQFITVPLSLIVNILIGRYLGPQDFGVLYLLGTVTSFAFLVADWGQSGALTGAVARTPGRWGELFGSALLFRLPMAVLAYAACAYGLRALGYPPSIQPPLAVAFILGLFVSVGATITSVLRGQERISLVVRLNIVTALGSVAPVVSLFLGAGLMQWLWANVATSLVALGVSAAVFRAVNRGPLRPEWATGRELLRGGTAFMVLGGVLALQPYVDTLILARLAPAEVVGWHAASRRIFGVLIFPSTTLAAALFPTLARLRAESQEAWARLTRTAVEAVALLSVPASVGCFLFADVAVALFNRDAFGPAAENLRVMSAFVFLVYFTIVIGTALMAAGKQAPWAWAQSCCVLVSAVADPLLIPLFQRTLGNGGVGVAVSTIGSEVLMVLAALWLAPRGTLGLPFVRTLGRALAAGAAMVVAALLTQGFAWPARVIASICAYAVTVVALGGVGPEPRRIFRDVVLAKLRR
jgi:O-antigen/teichoic acid export membrane protein